MKRVFIIAEIGVNHNGSFDIAKKMVAAAKSCGADAIKFQTFRANKLITKSAPKAAYQRALTGQQDSQYEMIKRLELRPGEFKLLKEYCKESDIIFLSSPFDIDSINLLNEMGLDIFKIPSGEITNLLYLRKIGSLNKKVILSSGMADLNEIEEALDVIIKSGTKKSDITVLQCNTEYPTPFDHVNLKAMITIKEALNVVVGLSDHSLGIVIPIAAVALGAMVIEKHFTLDKNMSGPDHKASLDPAEFKAMVEAIRNTEKAMGNGVKKPSPAELTNLPYVRKSVVAARDIRKGEKLTEENIAIKRPGTGINPMRWDEIVGTLALRDYEEDEVIEL